MSDDRNMVEVARDVSRNWTGEAMTTDGMLEEFQLFGHAKRADILDRLDTEFRDADTSDLRKFTELATFRRNMKQLHDTLRKVSR